MKEAQTDELFSIDFNPLNEHTFLTGSKDASIILWDMRKPDFRLHSFENHSEAVDYH
jgi:histone-binding protein RBBP4